MVSRRRMRQVISSMTKLKDRNLDHIHHGIGKLFISESMAPAFRQLDFYCRLLKKRGAINACWLFNGNYNIKLQENDRKIRISHVTDIEKATGYTEANILDMRAQ